MNIIALYYKTLFCILICSFVYGQNTDLSNGISDINKGRYHNAITSFQNIDTLLIKTEDKALLNFYLGYAYNLIDQQDLAYLYMLKAKTIYRTLKKENDVKDCNLQLLTILGHQNKLKNNSQIIIDELEMYLATKEEELPDVKFKIYKQIGSNYLSTNLLNEAKAIFKKSLALSMKIKDTLQVSFDLMNLGTAYKAIKEYDSALFYTKKGLPYLKKINDSLNLSYNYHNQAEAYKYLHDYNKSLQYFYKADSLIPSKNKIKSKIVFYKNIADLYEQTKDYPKAYFFTKERNLLEDSINDSAQNIAIEDFRTKYQTAEKEKQNLILQSEVEKEQRKQRNLWLGGIITLVIGSILAFLLYKNTKRKQRIAEQEREIEIQKTEKLLKDQELTTIDAMIEGQEKERQRLASDLHDSVGATLSAARLQFEHLQKHKGSLQNKEEVFSKTGALLEEAYQEVRSMAHIKNSGVIAKNGLLPAIEKLAKSISVSNQLNIEVQDFGLTERIDNSLEITIFRIIQELVTNIIKHANASEASISLTQLEDTINIIVEDNGKGFDARNLSKKEEGMGLSSIEKRVEHLEGSMEVDATPGKGTNILIDIPI